MFQSSGYVLPFADFDKSDFLCIMAMLFGICEVLMKYRSRLKNNEYDFWRGCWVHDTQILSDSTFPLWLHHLCIRIANPPAFFDYLKARCDIVLPEPSPVVAALPPAVSSSAPAEECSICMDAKPDAVFVECGHVACCLACAQNPALKECPICRKEKKLVVKVFFA